MQVGAQFQDVTGNAHGVNMLGMGDITIKGYDHQIHKVPDTLYQIDTVNYERSGDYRFGFNGMEKDDEVKGIGNSINYKARIYDPRLGRFLSVDPLTNEFPWYTPYQFAGNKPIWAIDLDGLEEFFRTTYYVDGKLWKTELSVASDADIHRGIQRVHNTRVDIDGDKITARYTGSQKGRNVLTDQERADVYPIVHKKDGTRYQSGVSSSPLGFVRDEIMEGSESNLDDMKKSASSPVKGKREYAGQTKTFVHDESLNPNIELPSNLNAVPQKAEQRIDSEGNMVGGADKFNTGMKPLGKDEDSNINFNGSEIEIQGSGTGG